MLGTSEGNWHPGMEFGPYRLEHLIGRGGAGEVWLATDSRLKRQVAIKVLSGRDSTSGSVERFAREAQLTAVFNHPSIVTVHDVGRHEGTPYIVMEYVDGPDLLQVISSGRRTPICFRPTHVLRQGKPVRLARCCRFGGLQASSEAFST